MTRSHPRHAALLLAISLALGTSAATVSAQSYDGSAYFTPVMDSFSPAIYGNVFSKSYMENVGKGGARERAPRAPRSEAGTASIDTRFGFDRSVSADVKNDYIDAIARSSGERPASGLRSYYDSNNVRDLFEVAIAPYGLRSDDLADIAAAHMVVLWMTANDVPPPGKAEVLGVRDQVRAQMADGALPRSGIERQRIGEALMYQTVTLIRVRETAQQGRETAYLAALADSAQDSMQKKSIDLRAMAMTPDGLVLR